jgi:hypothetical protein
MLNINKHIFSKFSTKVKGLKQNKKKALHLIILKRPIIISGKLNCLLYIYIKMNFQISRPITLWVRPWFNIQVLLMFLYCNLSSPTFVRKYK